MQWLERLGLTDCRGQILRLLGEDRRADLQRFLPERLRTMLSERDEELFGWRVALHTPALDRRGVHVAVLGIAEELREPARLRDARRRHGRPASRDDLELVPVILGAFARLVKVRRLPAVGGILSRTPGASVSSYESRFQRFFVSARDRTTRANSRFEQLPAQFLSAERRLARRTAFRFEDSLESRANAVARGRIEQGAITIDELRVQIDRHPGIARLRKHPAKLAEELAGFASRGRRPIVEEPDERARLLALLADGMDRDVATLRLVERGNRLRNAVDDEPSPGVLQ